MKSCNVLGKGVIAKIIMTKTDINLNLFIDAKYSGILTVNLNGGSNAK